jgi:short-subunit dehydrogenase
MGGPESVSVTFKDRVTVITGASSGIGWALAKELAKQGAKLGLIARRLDKLEALASEIHKDGLSNDVALASADVSSRDQTQQAFRSIRARLGPVDLLIANAGVGAPTLLNPVNIDQVERMFNVNLFGVVYCIEAVLPDMLARRQGHIAAMSSLAGYKGLPGESAYCASKAAVNTYMEGLRIQLRHHNIAVTTICPGFVRTPMTEPFEFKMPFVMEADVAARRIVAALRRRRKVYNFPLLTSWMIKLTNWVPDWIMARGMKSYSEDPPRGSSM